jgi:hypothetical protein
MDTPVQSLWNFRAEITGITNGIVNNDCCHDNILVTLL